jgi:hypothetical protein
MEGAEEAGRHDDYVHSRLAKAEMQVRELENTLKVTVESALQLLSAQYCVKHQEEVRLESFDSYSEKDGGECIRCYRERVSEVEKALVPLARAAQLVAVSDRRDPSEVYLWAERLNGQITEAITLADAQKALAVLYGRKED